MFLAADDKVLLLLLPLPPLPLQSAVAGLAAGVFFLTFALPKKLMSDLDWVLDLPLPPLVGDEPIRLIAADGDLASGGFLFVLKLLPFGTAAVAAAV